MSNDPSLKPIEKLDYETYHKIILDLLAKDKRTKDLVSFVLPEHTKSIFDEPTKKIYPARATVNDVAALARSRQRVEQSATLQGYIIPGCDIPDTRGGGTNIQGWRPNMIVTIENGKHLDKPKVIGLTVWGERVPLYAERDVPEKDQTRVHLPMFRPITVVAEENEFDAKKYPGQKFKGWTLLFLVKVSSEKPISIASLVLLLKSSQQVIKVEDINENMVFSTLVLTDIKWLNVESIDEWVDDPENYDRVEKKGPDGQTLMRRDGASGRMVPVVEIRAKRKKSITGQPFIQEVIGSGEEGGEAVETVTMKISVGPKDDTENPNRATVEFQNYRYGSPSLFMFGLKHIIRNAVLRGNFMDPDPTKDPYAVLNNSYRGQPLIAVCNFARHGPHTFQGETIYYITLIAGLVMFEDASAMDPSDTPIPPMPEIPTDIDSERVDIVPHTVPESDKEKVVIVQDEYDPVDNDPFADDDTDGIYDDDTPPTRAEELDELSNKQIKDILAKYRKDGHEVDLRGKRSNLVRQVLDIESGKIVAAKDVMEAHAKEVKTEEADEEEQVAKAKAKLLAKRKAQADAGKELEPTSGDLTDQQLEQLEKRLMKTIKDVTGPPMDFGEMWGEDNDLRAFPEWITVHHRDLVDTMLERLYKKLGRSTN